MRKISKSFKTFRSKLLEIIDSMSVSEKIIFGCFFIILIISSLILLKKASDAIATETPVEGGSLSEGVVGYPRYINPLLPITDAGRDLGRLVYSGLMKVSADGSIVPDLAESFSISENGLVYKIILKDDLYFHDGTPLTAYDVEFTTKRATDPVIKSPKAADWNGVEIKVLDERTIEFTLKKAYSPFIENMTLGILPKHIWNDVGSDAFLFSEFNFEPIGSGPYKIKAVKRNASGLPDYYHLVPFDKYASNKAYISDLYIHFYPNESELITAYKSGTIHSMSSISPESVVSTSDSRSKIISTPLPRFYAVFLNQNQSKIFANKAVRQALSLSAPQEEIIKSVLMGYGTPINSPLPQNISESPENTTYEESFKRAQSILAKDGWSIATSTGILTQKAKSGAGSATLSFSLAVPDVSELKASAEMLKQAWEKLGAKVNIQIFDSPDLEQNVITPRKFDALLFGESIGRNADLFAFWHSKERVSPGLNIAEYTNAKADKLLESARASNDFEARTKLYQQFEKEILNDTPAVFLYSPDLIYVVPNALKGVIVTNITDSSERFSNISNWYLETEKIWKFSK